MTTGGDHGRFEVRRHVVCHEVEFDRSEHPFRQAVLQSPIEHKGGVVRVPDGPGLGIEVDREAVERFWKTSP